MMRGPIKTPWLFRGLGTGIKTTPYPAHPDTSAGITPGMPEGGAALGPEAEKIAARCPSGALRAEANRVWFDERKCVHAFRCVRQTAPGLPWRDDFEWGRAVAPGDVGDGLISSEEGLGDETGLVEAGRARFGASFGRSLHILVVDAGDCGACLREVHQLNNPYYNLHRLGFFFTPTPRHADVLMVVGPVTDQMRFALEKTYQAMPSPKQVMAVGACAVSGGVFGPSFVSEGGVGSILPVHAEVPGQPPPPLAILHGLLVMVGRRPSAPPRDAGAAAPGGNP